VEVAAIEIVAAKRQGTEQVCLLAVLVSRGLFVNLFSTRVLGTTAAKGKFFKLVSCLPMAPAPLIMGAETSVRRRFLRSSRASRGLPVPVQLWYRDQSTRLRRDFNSRLPGRPYSVSMQCVVNDYLVGVGEPSKDPEAYSLKRSLR